MNKIISFVVLICFMCSCENTLVKNYGGTMDIELPQCQKLSLATWKDDDLWYMTRPMRDNELAETWTLKEESTLGIAEGRVIFHESCR